MNIYVIIALMLIISLALNAMQAAKAADWRAKLKKANYQIDLLTRPLDDDEAVHTFDPADRSTEKGRQESYDDWLTTHPGPQAKPGLERKRR